MPLTLPGVLGPGTASVRSSAVAAEAGPAPGAKAVLSTAGDPHVSCALPSHAGWAGGRRLGQRRRGLEVPHWGLEVRGGCPCNENRLAEAQLPARVGTSLPWKSQQGPPPQAHQQKLLLLCAGSDCVGGERSGAGPSEALALPPTPREGPSWLGPKAPTQDLSLSCDLWGSHKPPGSWPVYPVYSIRKTEAPVCLAWVPRRPSVPNCAAALSLHHSRTYGFIIPSFETGGGKWRGGPREPGFGRATCMMQRSEHLAGHVATLLGEPWFR